MMMCPLLRGGRYGGGNDLIRQIWHTIMPHGSGDGDGPQREADGKGTAGLASGNAHDIVIAIQE